LQYEKRTRSLCRPDDEINTIEDRESPREYVHLIQKIWKDRSSREEYCNRSFAISIVSISRVRIDPLTSPGRFLDRVEDANRRASTRGRLTVTPKHAHRSREGSRGYRWGAPRVRASQQTEAGSSDGSILAPVGRGPRKSGGPTTRRCRGTKHGQTAWRPPVSFLPGAGVATPTYYPSTDPPHAAPPRERPRSRRRIGQ